MRTRTFEYLIHIMQGCKADDYQSICKASMLLTALAAGREDIEVEPEMRRIYIDSLYRKFMRAYTRYILANPNSLHQISEDCNFTSYGDGVCTGIEEV